MGSKNSSKSSSTNRSEESAYGSYSSISSRSRSEHPLRIPETRDTLRETSRTFSGNKVVKQFWKLSDSLNIPSYIKEELHDKMRTLLYPYMGKVEVEEFISEEESDDDLDKTSTSSGDSVETPPKRMKSNAVVPEWENVEPNSSDEDLTIEPPTSPEDSEEEAPRAPEQMKPKEIVLEPESVELTERSNIPVDPTKCRLVTAQLAKELLCSLSLNGCVRRVA